MPCATQNELDGDEAQTLVANGCICVAEGANMPSTPEAIKAFQDHKLLYSPGKASNAGGVATSGLEMSQNSMRLVWSPEEVDAKLHSIMKNIHAACVKYGTRAGRLRELREGREHRRFHEGGQRDAGTGLRIVLAEISAIRRGRFFRPRFFYAACGREDVALFGMRAVCPKTKGPRAVGCRRTVPERMPILSGRFASGDPSSVRYSGQYEKADACRPCLACEERVVGLLAKKLSEPGPAGDGLPCRDFTVRRVVSRRPARSVSGCRRSLPLPGSSRRSGRGVAVPYAGGGELLLSGCQRRLRTVFPAEKRSFGA